MKPIKIDAKNEAAIVLALGAVNGRAEAHAYTTFPEINRIANRAESKMIGLVGAQARAVGATVTSTSGNEMCNAYAKKNHGTRPATRVVIERRATGWFLIDAQRADVWQQGGGADVLTLTQAQADCAVSRLKEQFRIAAPAPVALAA